MSIDPNNAYTAMQRASYESGANQWSLENKDHVVGSFDGHNNHEDYELLFEGMTDLQDKVMLDFGCGPGRNIIKYWDRFARIDGADIAQENLNKARFWAQHNGKDRDALQLYQTDGISLSGVHSGAYDIVMSTITFQHIPVHEIRYSIMQDIHRVLKPYGWFTAQMGFGPGKPDAAEYNENRYDAGSTNGSYDTRVTDPKQLEDDLNAIGFRNFSHVIRDPVPGDNHTSAIFFRAQK
jgi:SAM-dependent methyltransferase